MYKFLLFFCLTFTSIVYCQDVKGYKYIYSYAQGTLPELPIGNKVKVVFDATKKAYTVSCYNIDNELVVLSLLFDSEFDSEVDNTKWWNMKDKGGTEYIVEQNQEDEFVFAIRVGYKITTLIECTNEKYVD